MEPVTRKEHFLARIAGKPHDESLFPITREEFFLNDIAESGGGGSGGGGAFVIGISEETSDNKTIRTLDKTAQEISTAMAAGKIAFADLVRDGFFKSTERFYVIGVTFPPGGAPIVCCVAAVDLFNDSGVQIVSFKENKEGYPSITINNGIAQ